MLPVEALMAITCPAVGSLAFCLSDPENTSPRDTTGDAPSITPPKDTFQMYSPVDALTAHSWQSLDLEVMNLIFKMMSFASLI